MKHPILCILVILLAVQTTAAQAKPGTPPTKNAPKRPDTVFTLCGKPDSITAWADGKTYYLQVGSKSKKQKVGKSLTRDSAQKAYFKLLESSLVKECKTLPENEESQFYVFVNAYTTKILNALFPPPTIPGPVAIESDTLDPTHILVLLSTTNNNKLLSEYTLPNSPAEDIFAWNSSGKLTNFDVKKIDAGGPLLWRNLPRLLALQAKAGKAQYPQFFLLYNGSDDNYELIESDNPDSGMHTGILIPAAIGDTIVTTGKTTTLSIKNQKLNAIQKLNVQPVRNTVSSAAAAATTNTSKPRASPKGELIAHQQLNSGADSPCLVAAYLYIPSPSDSILFSLKGKARTIPDTAMPMDFSPAELKDWVRPALPASASRKDSRTDSLLSNFALVAATKAPFYAKDYLARQKPTTDTGQAKPAANTPATVNKTTPGTAAPKTPTEGAADASTPTPPKKPDSLPNGTAVKDTAQDSLAKYSILNNITFLNAFNFDFTGKLTTSYMGVFNIFAPDFYKFRVNKKKFRMGFIAGIEKINYSTANINGNDSSQTAYIYQYVLANPASYDFIGNQIAPGSKYYYQYNKYTSTSQNTVWSIYFQPTWRTNFIKYDSSNPKVGFYYHLHLELLVNQWTSTVSYRTIAADSANYGPGSPPVGSFNHYLPSSYTTNANILTENFGAGFTYYVAPFTKDTNSHFFIQGTLGVSLNSPNFLNLGSFITRTSQTTVALPPTNGTISNAAFTHPKAFYLVRAIFLQSLSNRTELIIGTTIRGIFGPGSNAPQYAIYVGLNLDLNVITDLFKSKPSS